MKTRLMKRMAMVVVMALSTAFLFAHEKGEMGAGVNLSYGTKSGFSNFGIGAKFQYNIIDNLRIEPSATYFLKKDLVSMWDINANVHYLFGISDSFRLYPLAGVCLLGTSVDYLGVSASASDFGFNLGGGGEYLLTEKFALNLEIKYQIVSGWNRPVFSLGAAYKF
ncbi:MAG: porin family protein [Bacteroides sp.]|uniref:porin family protein n=1 Tax=Bacteroides sp. TaxID=29523 RepID=UPI0025BE6507|nr:porin family protein [Bacteroides sp.]MBS6237369.1 porin family protein [Bacteroides sp.]